MNSNHSITNTFLTLYLLFTHFTHLYIMYTHGVVIHQNNLVLEDID